jgi:hypothetical protein
MREVRDLIARVADTDVTVLSVERRHRKNWSRA